MALKYIPLDDSVYRYLSGLRSDASNPVLQELRDETNRLGEISQMQISEEQGTFMSLLVAAVGARSAIEVGTFTGYSSICIARGLPSGGRLICLDSSKEWTSVAQRYWNKAGVHEHIELRLGPAIPALQQLEPGLTFDFVFIDAAKTEYDAYYELLLPRVRPSGLILFDNMLWGGRLRGDAVADPDGHALDALNHKLAADPRIECVLLPIADGIQMCRKR